MFKLWPENFDWSWHLARPIAEAIYGGGEFHEIHRAAERITPGDTESWYGEWDRVAHHVEALGREAEWAGHGITARDHYLRACNYYRWAEFFLLPEDPRRLPAYDRCVACFRAAGRFFVPPLEQVEIPYEGTSLPGYFYPAMHAPAGRQPGLLYVAGADVLKEELYFLGGKAAIERGMALLVMDGPGQGETLRHRGLPSRFDYEVPVRAALDYLAARPEVDSKRIALLGRSFGGYYAARAAAFERRLRGCAIFGALYDGGDLFDTYPPIRNQLRWLTGAKDLAEARERLRRFSLQGIVEKITCPLLVVHGEDDHLVPAWHARRTFDEARTEKRLVLYKPGEPGSIHCSYDGFPYTIPTIVDWLADRLNA
ncbi:MAG TPA: prolyl oligopeptidase family serine peptidase [Candidatus Sulfotelmatobacter sp.]|nr:prolyl oligopeptidase family serine peptidase [Candidatus Sulfotelmatobacter sp.]